MGRPVPRPSADPGATPSTYLHELRQGWDFLRTDPVLVAVCLMVALTNLVDQAYAAVLAPVWAQESGAGVEALGALFAVFSGASVLGALAAARWGETLPRFRTYVVAFLVAGAPRFVVMALESPLWAVFAVTVVAGAASGFLNPILGAVILERIPAPLMGRVSSLNTAICWSLMPLGGILGGLAVTALGISPALLVAGAAYLVTTMAPTRVAAFRAMDRPEVKSPLERGSDALLADATPQKRTFRPASHRGKVRASSSTRSLASVSPIVTRAPSPAKGRTTMPSSSAAAANSPVRSPSPNHTKLPCASGTSHPASRIPATTRARSATSASTRSSSSASASSEAIAAAWATDETPKGSDTERSAPASGACAIA